MKGLAYQCPKLVLYHRLYIFLCIYYLLLTIPRSCRNFIKVVYVYYSTHYNAYTTLQITISHYIILFYNTLLRTVRIQIHYYSPGCSYCSSYFYCLYHYKVLGFPRGFPLKKDQRTANYLFESCSYCKQVCVDFQWIFNFFPLFSFT